MSNVLRQSVCAAIRAFTIPLEGRKSWLYLDAIGLPTTGIGCALGTPDQSARLAWRRADGSRATDEEIRTEWAKLKARTDLINTLAESQLKHVTLHLADEEIERLFWERVNATGEALSRKFVDFSGYPAPAQFALLSMGFAMGTKRFDEFVRFRAALDRCDWPQVAVECFMKGEGLAERNRQNRRLFLLAAAIETDGGDPDALDLSKPTLVELETRFGLRGGEPHPPPLSPVEGPVPGASEAVAIGWQAGVTAERNPER